MKSSSTTRKLVITGLAVSAFALAACTSHGSSTHSSAPAPAPANGSGSAASTSLPAVGAKKIGVVSVAGTSGGTIRMIAEMQKLGKTQGWTVQSVDAAGDPTKVTSAINSFIASKVNGIVVDVLDPSVVAPAIAKAKAAGIPVISTSSNEYDPDVVQQIVANPFQVGALEATYTADRLHRSGNVAVLEFSGSSNIVQRTDTLLAALKSYPGIHVVATHNVDVTQAGTDAQNTVQQWLTQFPKGKLDAVIAPWDEPATGAANAIDAAGRSDVFVTGADYDPAAGALIKQNKAYQADFFIDYASAGDVADHTFAAIFQKQKVPARVYLNTGLVTPETVPGSGFPPSPGTYTVWSGQ